LQPHAPTTHVEVDTVDGRTYTSAGGVPTVTGNVDQFPSFPFLESYAKSADAFWNQNQNYVKIYIPYLTERDVDSTGYGHGHCHSPCGVEEENTRRMDKREQAHPLKRAGLGMIPEVLILKRYRNVLVSIASFDTISIQYRYFNRIWVIKRV
jgi:hypothetical protein